MFLETIFYSLYKIISSFTGLLTGQGPLAFWKTASFSHFIFWYKIFAGIVIATLFCGLAYVAYRMILLGNEVKKREGDAKRGVIVKKGLSAGAQRWTQIMEKLNSESEADWKVAILEADAILEEIVGTMNLMGTSIGDKLKSVEPSDFLTLESAWEAHKARNRIAHDVSGVPLSHREAQRILVLYEKVLREFEYL